MGQSGLISAELPRQISQGDVEYILEGLRKMLVS
jgi:hypothetical protein